MCYPAMSVQVARGTGAVEGHTGFEAPPTMWPVRTLRLTGLLARMVPRLHKKLPTEALNLGTSSGKEVDVVTEILISEL